MAHKRAACIMAQALLLTAYKVAREKQIQDNAAVVAAKDFGFNSPSAENEVLKRAARNVVDVVDVVGSRPQ